MSPAVAAACAEARARRQDQQWRELVGETEEDQQKILDEVTEKSAAAALLVPPP